MERLATKWRPQTPRFSASLLMFWISIVCLLGQFLAVTHPALVEHQLCAKHGEWVHAEEHSHEKGSADQHHNEVDHSEDAPGGDEGHQHCSCLSDPRLFTVTAELQLQAQRPDFYSLPEVVAHLEVMPRVRIYLLAPKTSPPA